MDRMRRYSRVVGPMRTEWDQANWSMEADGLGLKCSDTENGGGFTLVFGDAEAAETWVKGLLADLERFK